jgi:outer membrane protein OmpA-like peptidoglycan-associated protein
LFSLRFNHGSAVPRDRGIEEKAARMAQWLKSHPQAILYIDGHADATGPEEINLVISYRRAAATASLIEKAGARRSQLVPRAYGEGPSAAQTTRSQPQRRVTLTTDAERACGKPGFSDGGPE